MRKILVVGLACLVAISGCTVGPDYERPSIDLPSSKLASTHLSQEQRQALAAWWKRFDDPTLTHLIQDALDRNLKIAKQVQVVREERAALGLANAQFYPTVSAQAEAAREYQSLAGTQTGGGGSSDRSYHTFSVAGTLSYEFNLFGKLQRAQQAAQAQLLSTVYAKDSIRLTVIADVVANYMTLRSLQRRIHATNDTIDTRKTGLDLNKKRFEFGAISKLELLQASSLLHSARAQLPPLKKQLAKQRSALAILTGKTPRQIMKRIRIPEGNFDDIHIPDLPEVIPSLVIERRPDIRAAEANLIAANANVGKAKAKFFPTFNISAMLGTKALDISDLFNPVATFSNVAGSIVQPILDFGRRSANLQIEKAQKKQAMIEYRQTVRRAFKSVSDAMNAIKYTRQRMQAVRNELDNFNAILDLAQTRYKAGQIAYFNVLDARRKVFSTKLDLAVAIRNRFTTIANLYKALGGGWTRETDSLTPAMAKTMQDYANQKEEQSATANANSAD